MQMEQSEYFATKTATRAKTSFFSNKEIFWKEIYVCTWVVNQCMHNAKSASLLTEPVVGAFQNIGPPATTSPEPDVPSRSQYMCLPHSVNIPETSQWEVPISQKMIWRICHLSTLIWNFSTLLDSIKCKGRREETFKTTRISFAPPFPVHQPCPG